MSAIRILSYDDTLNLASGYLVTINLQHLYLSISNEAFRDAIFLNPNARFCVDGRGARFLYQRAFGCKAPLTAGNEVLRGWLEKGNQKILVVGTNEKIIDEVSRKYLSTNIVHDPSWIPQLDLMSAEREAARIVARFGTNFTMVALALGVPKQEILAQALSKHIQNLPILCIGGSFEMIAGHYRRAPILFQRLGLEGLWRLLIQPSRERLFRLVKSYWYFLIFLLARQKFKHLVNGEKP